MIQGLGNADLQFGDLVVVVLFGSEVEAGHIGGEATYRAGIVPTIPLHFHHPWRSDVGVRAHDSNVETLVLGISWQLRFDHLLERPVLALERALKFASPTKSVVWR